MASAMTGTEGGGTVQDDSTALADTGRARDRDMNIRELVTSTSFRWPADPAMNGPQLGGTQVTQHRALAARQDSRHPTTAIAQSGVADRINTTMNGVKAAGLCALRYPPSR
jgi:hypothetical protein